MDVRYDRTHIQVGDIAILFGLNWRQLAGLSSESTEVREYSKELSSRHYSLVRREGHDTYVGFTPAGSRLPRKVKAVSAAALLAASSDKGNAVFFWAAEDEDLAYVVCVRNGEPAAEFDFAGPREDAIERAKEFGQVCTGEGILIYGNASEEFPDNIDQGLDFLVGKSVDFKVAGIRSVPIVPAWLVVGVLVAAIAGGGYGGFKYIKKRNYVPPIVQSPSELYAASLPEAIPSMGPTLRSAIQVMDKINKNVGVSVGGWDLRRLSCNFIDGSCEIEWSRKVGTYQTLVAAAPRGDGFSPVAVVGLSDSAKQVLQLNKDLLLKPVVDHGKTPIQSAFFVHFGSVLQRVKDLGVSAKLGEPVPFAMPPGVVDPSSIPELVKSGGWTVSMPVSMYRLAELFPENMTIQSMKIEGQSASNFTVSAEGVFYVK